MKLKINWDALGVATSTVCAIHCAILPLLATSLPIFGIDVIHNQLFEWSMIGIALFVGTYSLYHGYKKHHRSYLPMILFFIGFLFLVLKQFFHPVEYLFLAAAVALIISAHFLNYRYCQQSKCSSPHHKH